MFLPISGCLSTSPEIIDSDAKHIQSPYHPEYYTNNLECKWLVKAPSNKIVKFLVSKVDLAPNDFLEIRDGVNESAVLSKNVTSTSETQPLNKFIKASGHLLWVKFKSDHQLVGKGFSIHLVFENRISSE